MIINRNMAGINIMSKLNNNEKASAKSMERLSTGMRINHAADDVAGSAISEKMRSQIRGLEQAQRNIQDGISFIQTAEIGLAKIADPNLHRLRELAVQAANGTLSSGDRRAIQNEVNQILDNIDDIANNTSYNGTQLLNVPNTIPADSKNRPADKSDIVFILDKTGSMGEKLASIEENLQDFTTELKIKGIDIKLGMVAYGDSVPTQGGDPVVATSFTSDINKFEKSISEIVVAGGGDLPESGLEGISEAMNFEFREDASKQFIFVTDAEVHDNDNSDGGDGLSELDIDDIAEMVKESEIKLTVIGPENNAIETQLKRLSEPTGGNYLDLNGDFSSQLKSLARGIVNDSLSGNVDLFLQVGANIGDVYGIDLTDARTNALGIEKLKVDPWEEAEKAISKLDVAMQHVSSERSKYGTYENALNHIHNSSVVYAENLTAAESRIRDVDMAKEIMVLTKNNILTQASQAMMSQVNKQPESVLELLK